MKPLGVAVASQNIENLVIGDFNANLDWKTKLETYGWICVLEEYPFPRNPTANTWVNMELDVPYLYEGGNLGVLVVGARATPNNTGVNCANEIHVRYFSGYGLSGSRRGEYDMTNNSAGDCTPNYSTPVTTTKTAPTAFNTYIPFLRMEYVFSLGPRYDLTVNTNDPTMGTVTGSATNVPENDVKTITATTTNDILYKFIHWENQNGSILSTSPIHTITMVKDTIVTAIFSHRDCSLTVNSSVGGTTTPSGTVVRDWGTVETVTAIANPGYAFIHWIDEENTIVNTENPIDVTITGDTTLMAIFESRQCDLTVNVRGYGSVNPNGRVRMYYGAQAVLTATADEGCVFKHWVDVNNNVISTDNPFTMILQGDTVLTGVIDGYIVTIQSSQGGKVDSSGTYRKFADDTMKITATANSLYGFKSWNDRSGNFVSSDNPFNLVIQSDTQIVANFVMTPSLTLQSDPPGAIFTGEGEYEINTFARVSVDFPSGCPEFKYWTNEQNIILDTARTIDVEVTGIMTLTAHFVSYELNVSRIGDGSVSVVRGDNVVFGEGIIPVSCATIPSRITLTATPDSGCIFLHWRDENNIVSGNNPLVITMDSDEFRIAVFERIKPIDSTQKYVVELISSPLDGGVLSGGGEYFSNSSGMISAVANSGFKFVYWSDRDNNIVSTNRSFTLLVTRDTLLTAYFEESDAPSVYTVQLFAEPTAGGTVTGSGDYDDNSSVTISASARSGYNFVHWLDKYEKIISTNPELTIIVVCDTILTAIFEEVPVQKYNVQLKSMPSDGGVVTGSGDYNANSSVTISAAVANQNYVFSGWFDESENVISMSANHTIILTCDTILIAHFDDVSIREYISHPIKIYPNPTSESTVLTLELDVSCEMQIVLSDILGNDLLLVHDGFADAGIFIRTIRTKDFSAGVYLLKISINGHQIVEKIIVY